MDVRYLTSYQSCICTKFKEKSFPKFLLVALHGILISGGSRVTDMCMDSKVTLRNNNTDMGWHHYIFEFENVKLVVRTGAVSLNSSRRSAIRFFIGRSSEG